MILALNFVFFQLGWFASVIGAANQLPWIGPAVVALVVAWHLHTAERATEEALLIVLCAAIGVLFDSLLVALGWVQYPSGMLAPWLAPYWIIGMWILFATTLNFSLRWLRGRAWLGAVLGLTGGPLSYVAGAELGGIEFVDRVASLTALALGWALILPALVAVARRLDGVGARGQVPPAKRTEVA
jgi:hypothetical protein